MTDANVHTPPPDLASLSAPLEGIWLASEGGEQAWNLATSAAASVPPAYVPSFARYQAAYVRERVSAHVDLSVVLRVDRRPVAVWPFSASLDADGWRLGLHDAPVRPPLLCAPLPDRVLKRLFAECFGLIESLASRLGISTLTTVEWPRDGRLGLFHQTQLERGARISTTHMLAVDLGLDLAAIRQNFRKSFRPLVTKGLATWDSEVIARCRTPVWDEFRALHLEVAGRATRGASTWELQHDALERGDAFLVTLRDKTAGRLVGAGYFSTSRTDAIYAVGAYDRSLFQLPLGHVVQHRAIEHMKAQGLTWYWLGARPYPADDPAPTEKEMQIGAFKQGFATHLLPVLTVRGPALSGAGLVGA